MSNHYSIRTATPSDVTIINSLAAKIWGPTYLPILTKEQVDYMFGVIYTEQALQEQMQTGQTFLLLYDRDKPVGFAAYSIKEETTVTYKLNKKYLLPEYQGRGAGKFLLNKVEQEVAGLGGTALDLNVNRHNKAKTFYERCGYTIHEKEDIPIGPYWMNDYVMRKKL